MGGGRGKPNTFIIIVYNYQYRLSRQDVALSGPSIRQPKSMDGSKLIPVYHCNPLPPYVSVVKRQKGWLTFLYMGSLHCPPRFQAVWYLPRV